MIKLDTRFLSGFLADEEWKMAAPFLSDIHHRLHAGQVPGADFLGWLNLPSNTLSAGLDELLMVADEIKERADALVVIGIGGSYLGARAAFEWVAPEYYNQLPRQARGGPELYFAGNHLSARALQDLLRVLQGKRVYLNVISKSGTTTEPAVAFRILRNWLSEQVDAAVLKQQIIVTTDERRGALKQFATEQGLRTFVVPDDVGGRYSVLTPVGLLPLAAVGVNIQEMLTGAKDMEQELSMERVEDNAAYRYAAIRNALYRKGKVVEVLAAYEPAMRSFAEWWKQLFGESEGKDGKGIYPSSVAFTTDLHSLGQFIQEGNRNLFETVIRVEKAGEPMHLPSDKNVDDGLEYLAGRPLDFINDSARTATQIAHTDGGVPNILIDIPDMSARTLGGLFYFFELACAASGLLLGVNPFDQPGVEAYKTNMFALLGKPGYEAARAELEKRVQTP